MDFFTLPEDTSGFVFSHCVVSGGFLFIAGQIASDEPGWSGPAGDIEAETRMAMDRIGRILAAHGAGFEHVVRVGVFMTDLSGLDLMNAVYGSYFTAPRFPARTCVGVASLIDGNLIEIDCVARLPR
jgi:2-iminobutanoate/2-iminopropanoate deaminase